MRALLPGSVALALAMSAPATAEAPGLLADPEVPGPNLPPAGRSLFDELFERGPPAASRAGADYALPVPFERLLAALNDRVAPAEATTVLIPLGRSLQRHAADPDYFAGPRVVLAITEDAGTPDQPWLQDRLFLGFHEGAEVIEVISYNEAAGRFEFQMVEDYTPGRVPRVTYAERSICVACHQAHGPIFPVALWTETNADPRIAIRLAPLGETYHGAPTQSGVDRADAFDRATDRAARIAFANAVWSDGCGASDNPEAAQCRGDLLLAALRYRLGGARATPDDAESAALGGRLTEQLAAIAPAGLGAPSQDLPNRAPLAAIEAGIAPYDAVEPDGIFEPTLPRLPILFWSPAQPPAQLLTGVVRDLAAQFAEGDIVWLDARLATLTRSDAPDLLRARLPCQARTVELGAGNREVRLDCTGDVAAGQVTLTGHLTLAEGGPIGGSVRSLAVHGRAPVHRLSVAGGFAQRELDALTLVLPLREAALGLSARLASGERLTPLVLRLATDGAGEIELAALDDLGPLRAAVALMVERTATDPNAALGAGPLRRRAVLGELAAALGSD